MDEKFTNTILMSLLIGFIVGSAVGHGQTGVALLFITIWIAIMTRYFYGNYKLYEEQLKSGKGQNDQ